jgi:hypothetical protein
MKSLRFLLMLSLLLYFSNESKGQLQCPDLSTYGITQTAFASLDPWDPLGNVEYKMKHNGGNNYEFYFDWSTLHNENRLGITDEELRWMLIEAAFNNLNCSGQITVKVFEEVNCYKELSCYIRVNFDRRIYCQTEGWTGSISWINKDGQYYYPITEKSFCGVGCCETTYTLECSPSANYWNIIDITKNSNGCEISTTLDCLNNEIIPCEANNCE